MADIDFFTDYQEVISQELSSLGHPPASGEDLDTILIRYLNLKRRIPPVLPWTVKLSKELTTKSFTQSIKSGLQKFIHQAKSGQNLKPYLSTKIDDPDYKDFMFYDWGIFHFHLGTILHPNRRGFVNRTGELLFAITDANKSEMYLIDIHLHKRGFTNQDLLRIIEENWAEILEPYTLNNVTESDCVASDNDIESFREAGINNILTTPSGRFLIPMGGGMEIGGTSFLNRTDADRSKTSVRELEERFNQKQEFIEKHFKSKYGKKWDDLTFKVKSFDPPVKIEEIITGEVFEIPS